MATGNYRFKSWLVCAAFAVSAVFCGVTYAQDDDGYGVDADAVDFAAPGQIEAPVAAPPAQAMADEPAPAAPPPPAVADAEDSGADAGQQATAGKSGGRAADKAGGEGGSTPLFAKPDFELSLGMATVDGRPWTRVALGVDIPIWKFGVFLDLELFINDESQVSNKGWDFKEHTAEAIFRKIRYIRYGREDEPLFVKFGGLSNVTLGYGMIVDRFTNMLRYPDEKLLGLQFYLNDVFPIGLTVQTLISDFAELADSGGVGGVYAARAALRPLKTSGIPLLDGLSVGAMYAIDANVQAPAKKWKIDGDDAMLKYIRDSTTFFQEYKDIYQKYKNQDPDAVLTKIDAEDSLRSNTRSFALYGFDAGLPVISTDFLSVELYGQSAFRADAVSGWGIGAPGVAVKLWKLAANVEYRKIEGRFAPGYFDTYYLDERYSRGLMKSKDEYIDDVSLNGVFGRLGFDMFGVINLGGSYQYMLGAEDASGNTPKSQSYEASAGIGETVMKRIPKFNLAEVYIRSANIGIYSKYDKDGKPVPGKDNDGKPVYNGNAPVYEKAGLFDRSPGMYWGYRTGFEITAGASLIWDYRYGWKEENGKLVPDNHMFLQTALRF
jgi:hypothetical protein